MQSSLLFFMQYFRYLLKSCINVTFHIKPELWLNVLIHIFPADYKQSKLCNGMCGLPLTINGVNKSPIYLSWRVVLSPSTCFSQQWATFKLSCPIILINSVYLGAVITENGLCNFSRLLVLWFGGWPRWSLAPLFFLKVTGVCSIWKWETPVRFPLFPVFCLLIFLTCSTNCLPYKYPGRLLGWYYSKLRIVFSILITQQQGWCSMLLFSPLKSVKWREIIAKEHGLLSIFASPFA